MKGPVLFLVLAGAVGAHGATVEDEAPNRPMTKVVNMLKDMHNSLKEESENDQEIYNKMACWCNNNKADKEKEIADSRTRIQELDSEQNSAAAKIERLKVEIKDTETELAENISSLDAAAEERRKEKAAFSSDDKDYLDAITAMESAIAVLERNYAGGEKKGERWIQQSEGSLLSIKASMSSHSQLFETMLSGSDYEALKAFVQGNPATAAYSAGGGGGKAIMGILKQMLTNFQDNMSDSQKEETAKESAFQEYKKTKEEQMAANQESLDAKNAELAETMNSLSNADKERIALAASLKEAQAFLLTVQTKCTSFQNEFDARVADRADEMKAVSKAIEILTSDEARASFSNTFNGNSARANAEKATAFLQVSHLSKKSEVEGILKRASIKLASPVLAQLAMSVKLDGFKVLLEKIDEVVKDTKQTMADEVKQKDYCTEAYAENAKKTSLATDQHEAQVAEKNRLQQEIESLNNELDQLKKDIENLNMQIKDAGNIRAKENAAFQQAIADQQTSIKLLEKALGVLRGYYSSFVQQEPQTFDKREGGNAGGGAGKVLNFLEQIIADSKKLEAETLNDEKDAQYGYEQFVQETNRSLDAKNKEVAAKTEAKANAEKSHAENDSAIADTESQLLSLSTESSDLKAECTFLMQNFDLRQQRMQEQIDALAEAKAILQGSGVLGSF